MTRDEFDTFCRSLRAATHVVQWRGASVWKVGGKMFALCSSPASRPHAKVRFKCSPMSYELLKMQDGIIPAPHLARAQWVQIESPDAMADDDIRLYLAEAHRIIAARLSRRVRTELGL